MKNNFWKAAIWAGIISGVIMLILELIMNPLFLGNSMWGPSRMIGAILVGQGALPPPPTFDFGILLAAMVVHFPLSIIYAIVIAFAVRKTSFAMALVIGALLGLVLYYINFYGFTVFFPWFSMARNWVQVFIHISFGIGAAWAFKGMFRPAVTATPS